MEYPTCSNNGSAKISCILFFNSLHKTWVMHLQFIKYYYYSISIFYKFLYDIKIYNKYYTFFISTEDVMTCRFWTGLSWCVLYKIHEESIEHLLLVVLIFHTFGGTSLGFVGCIFYGMDKICWRIFTTSCIIHYVVTICLSLSLWFGLFGIPGIYPFSRTNFYTPTYMPRVPWGFTTYFH